MKIIYGLFFITTTLFICCNKVDSNDNKNIETKKEMNRKVYFLKYDFVANGEIYFNGILLTKMTEEGANGANIYLNPFINKSGKQFISIKLRNVFSQELFPEYLKNIRLDIYSSDNFSENSDDVNLNLSDTFSLSEYNKSQTSIFHNWEFNADVNYELPNRLEDADDLSKEDISKLTNDVIDFYKKMHDALQNGDLDYYKSVSKESMIRDAKSMYYTESETQNYISKQVERASKVKGYMQPIQDYHMELGLDNKTIELINSEGESPLVSIDKEERVKTFGFLLYRDKKTGELKVY